MPRGLDEAHAYFVTTVELYENEDGAHKSRKRIRCHNPGCEFAAVIRNVDQSVNHLADAGAGAGFMTGCKKVSAAEVRDKFRERRDKKSVKIQVPSAEVVEKSMQKSKFKRVKTDKQMVSSEEATLSDLKKSEEEVLDVLGRWAFWNGLDPAIFSGEPWDKTFCAIRNAPSSMKPSRPEAIKVVFNRLNEADSVASGEALISSAADPISASAEFIPMEVSISAIAPKRNIATKTIRTHEV